MHGSRQNLHEQGYKVKVNYTTSTLTLPTFKTYVHALNLFS